MIASDCLGARMRILSRMASRVYDEMIRPHGVKFSQMNILTVVALHEPIAPVQVGRMLELEKSTLSRNAALMQASGWIEILAGEGNGQLLRATRDGRRLLEEAAPSWRAAQEQVESLLGKQTAAQIHRAADRLVGEGR